MDKRWPTLNASVDLGKPMPDRKHSDAGAPPLINKVGGQLNPTWVGWLMGWPLNWESLDPLTSLTWLSWEVDPADGEVVGRKWDTPSVGDSHPRALGIKKPYNGPGQEHLQSQALRQDSTGPIPRVATGVKDRVNRLKCLGNGIVPQCMYLAWRILTDEN